MATAVDKVFDGAFSLPSDARVSLVKKLLASLNVPTQAETDRLWAKVAERRVSQGDRGQVELTPRDEVFAKLRRKHQ